MFRNKLASTIFVKTNAQNFLVYNIPDFENGKKISSRRVNIFMRILFRSLQNGSVDRYLSKISRIIKIKEKVFMSSFPRSKTTQRIYNDLIRIVSLRRVFDLTLYQAPFTVETSVRLANLVKKYVNKSKILLVGDDDLLSICLAQLDKKCTVIDKDTFLLNLLTETAKLNNFDISIVKHDVFEKLDYQYSNNFDAFISHPNYEFNSISKFLQTGFQALKKFGYGIISIHSELSTYLIRALKRNSNCKILHVFKHFGHCYNWNYEILPFTVDVIILQISKNSGKEPISVDKRIFYAFKLLIEFNNKYPLLLDLLYPAQKLYGNCSVNLIQRKMADSKLTVKYKNNDLIRFEKVSNQSLLVRFLGNEEYAFYKLYKHLTSLPNIKKSKVSWNCHIF